MTPAAIIKHALEDGVTLALTQSGMIKAKGDKSTIIRWLPLIKENKPKIIQVLWEAANNVVPVISASEYPQEPFNFNPPNDPANDDEALQERVAIMMEGNGWSEATALRETRLNADRERCWRGFLLNAKRILDAPAWQSEALLAQYKVEAIGRYGQNTGAVMADELWAWVVARGVGGVQ